MSDKELKKALALIEQFQTHTPVHAQLPLFSDDE